jgi:hypothetical protein
LIERRLYEEGKVVKVLEVIQDEDYDAEQV